MKAVTLYRPVNFERALQDVDRHFESFFNGFPFTPSERSFNYGPAVDFRENSEGYVLEADLPGFDEKDVEIQLNGTTLTIESKKESDNETKKETYLLHERRILSFSRSFALPENADTENIKANFKNGVLELSIKKTLEAKKRTIPINR